MCLNLRKPFVEGEMVHRLWHINILFLNIFARDGILTSLLYLCNVFSWQAMEQKYALDEFWIQQLDFKRRVDASAFANLHEVRSIVNNIFLLVVRNNLGSKEVAEWQENLVFIEYLASNLGSQSHSWAMQKLKEVFGGRQGMSSSKKSLADKIVRETPQRTQGMLPQMNLPPPPQPFFWVGTGNDGTNASYPIWSC